MNRWAAMVVSVLGVVAVLVIDTGSAGATARRECAGIEGFNVYAQGQSTTCGFAQATAEAVSAYASDHKGAPRAHFSVRAHGLTMACHHYYFDSLETYGCNGKMRSVLIQAAR